MKKATSEAESGARTVANHPWFEKLARVGFVVSGLVHAMIGWICIRMATAGGSGESADQSGALREFADAPAGGTLLIIAAIAMFALALYFVLDVFFGAPAHEEGTEKIKEVGKALGKAGVYGALGYTAIQFGLGGSTDSGVSAEEVTSTFLASGFGRFLVVAVGIGIIAGGVFHIYRGWTKKFLEDMNVSSESSINKGVEVTGQIGYIAKGTALVGVGFILYGIFSILRAKYQQL